MSENIRNQNNTAAKTRTKIIVGTALFAALSFVVSLFEFAIFPQASFLKLDFSAVFVLLAGFMFGPIGAFCVSLIKELLRFTMSTTGGIGELANFVVTFGLYIVPSVVYRYKKGIKIVIITLVIGCFIQTALAVISNRYVMLPLFIPSGAKQVFDGIWYFIVLFNLIKTFSVSFLTLVLYKRLSYLYKRI